MFELTNKLLFLTLVNKNVNTEPVSIEFSKELEGVTLQNNKEDFDKFTEILKNTTDLEKRLELIYGPFLYFEYVDFGRTIRPKVYRVPKDQFEDFCTKFNENNMSNAIFSTVYFTRGDEVIFSTVRQF